MARGLKALVGFGTVRHAVIDVGTNSVKLHVGERRADGTWNAVLDRAIVSRLGEGLHATGKLGPDPMERTLDAIAAVAEEALSAGATTLAAVGTAGLRAAANAAEFVSAVEARSGARIEIIPGEDEGRLAYLAATSGLGLARGLARRLRHRRGQLPVHLRRRRGRLGAVQRAGRRGPPDGALRARRRHLADALRETLEQIASELDRLDGRPSPAVLVGMGGAVTNLAAVEKGLAVYDPDAIQGTRLDRAAVDRQIELYRTRTAEERRAIVGLQPNRAEVILAGACVVRVVLTKLGCDSLVVERPRPAARADRRPVRPRRARRLSVSGRPRARRRRRVGGSRGPVPARGDPGRRRSRAPAPRRASRARGAAGRRRSR